jgi:hypothetical protein
VCMLCTVIRYGPYRSLASVPSRCSLRRNIGNRPQALRMSTSSDVSTPAVAASTRQRLSDSSDGFDARPNA